MRKLMLALVTGAIFVFSTTASALPPGALPQPEFEKKNFLFTTDIPEMNVDFAIAWTDSAASFFLYPFDAVVLHVNVGGQMRDVFVISDMACDRLMTWVCTEPGASGARDLLIIGEFDGEPGDELRAPSGLATNAVNRQFQPQEDVIYLADRGNDRVIELRYQPDSLGGSFTYNRILGEGYLEWPVDVAISAYGDQQLSNADLYVVDWGRPSGNGELVRINVLSGLVEGSWHDILYPGSDIVISELSKPISVACFPFALDTLNSTTAVYVTEEQIGIVYLFESEPGSDPVFRDLNMLQIGDYMRLPGGVALDDFGRVYIANSIAGIIEMFGPNMNYFYAPFDTLTPPEGQLIHPTNLILDTYYDRCEALLLEMYHRESGLQTYEIAEAWSPAKPPLGFDGSGLPKIAGDSKPPLPARASLHDSYPNPFNDRCFISFFIPEQTAVRIEIFNILGQKVATLLDDTRHAGEHSVAFDAGSLSSGVYFYTLKSDGFSETKSMVLLK
jgi:hypothetical protein